MRSVRRSGRTPVSSRSALAPSHLISVIVTVHAQDFFRESDPSLPSFSLKVFAKHMFIQCEFLAAYAPDLDDIYANFLECVIRSRIIVAWRL